VWFGLVVVEFLFPVIIGADSNLVGLTKGGDGEVTLSLLFNELRPVLLFVVGCHDVLLVVRSTMSRG
jgi:hypothetical protein